MNRQNPGPEAKVSKAFIPFLILIFMMAGYHSVSAQPKQMIIRIAELEIHPNKLEEYKTILMEGAETSMRLEPGVFSIFPMYQKATPTQIRILEIYASKEAYESHLQTPHFQKYKTSTLHMVKSLQLITMEAIDAAAMTKIFSKLKANE